LQSAWLRKETHFRSEQLTRKTKQNTKTKGVQTQEKIFREFTHLSIHECPFARGIHRTGVAAAAERRTMATASVDEVTKKVESLTTEVTRHRFVGR
jgi:hypothetical protein